MQKTVYLIRHGETAYNRNKVHQDGSVPLSEIGLAQARRLAAHSATLGIRALVSSDYVRAQQTAECIAESTEKEVVIEPLFEEVRRPSEIIGKSFFAPYAASVFLSLLLHMGDASWHYSDEENPADFRERIRRTIACLEQRGEERIAVVTHRFVIGGILAELECSSCSVGQFTRRSISLGRVGNASVTTLTYDPERAQQWQVESVGDTTYLN